MALLKEEKQFFSGEVRKGQAAEGLELLMPTAPLQLFHQLDHKYGMYFKHAFETLYGGKVLCGREAV